MDFLVHLLVAVGLQFLSLALDALPPPQPVIPPPIERRERVDQPEPECPKGSSRRPGETGCRQDEAAPESAP
jgi:hypothetical protein